MSLNKLNSFMDAANIAESVKAEDDGENKLNKIGENVIDWFNQDFDSMKDWIEFAQLGVDLMKPERESKSTPWEGAANFHSPMMFEASLDFANRASLEVLRPKNLVKAEIIGLDKDGEKKKSADRVATFENYQINHQIKGWRKKHKKLLYSMPSYGTVFKKMVFDPLFGRPTSHLIQYPNFAVSQGAETLEEARSFTQVLSFSRNEVIARVEAGLWLDQDYYDDPAEGENASDTGSNEANDADTAADNDDRWFEQRSSIDLDGDGFAEPYIITVHESSGLVARIVARYDDKTIFVDYKDEILNLFDATEQLNADKGKNNEDIPDDLDFKQFKLVRIEPLQDVVKYGLIPSVDGTFLDLGYFHLLGALTMGVNTTTNLLLNTGHLITNPAGFLAKGFRKKMGPLRLKPGEWKSTNVDAAQLQSGMLTPPYREPSITLFQLNEKLELAGRQLAASTDLSGQLTAQTAPTTALALIHESLIAQSALMDGVVTGMTDEFQILFKIDQRTIKQKDYQTVLDDEEANFEKDFNSDLMDILPTANPEMSSKAQRIQTAEVFLSQLPVIVQAGGNPMAVIKNWADAINSEMSAEVFPESGGTMTPEEEQLIKSMQQTQEQQNALAAAQLEATQKQTELLDRELSRLEKETDAKVEKLSAEAQETRHNTRKSVLTLKEQVGQLKADIILTLEKAETEDTKNSINKYTAQIEGIQKKIDAIGAINDATSATTVNRGNTVPIRIQSPITGTV